MVTGSKELHSNSATNISDVVYSKKDVYVPDYTVRALTSLEYVKVRRHQYLAARRATMMEREPGSPDLASSAGGEEDPFAVEWKRAAQANSQLPQNHEEGILPPYMRIHQRNHSSGNLHELRSKSDAMMLNVSPLVGSHNSETLPTRVIIYPTDRAGPASTDTSERTGLLNSPRDPESH